eukprot:scaffold122795_cov36-Cyclotella_meneghiniana.AAC.1
MHVYPYYPLPGKMFYPRVLSMRLYPDVTARFTGYIGRWVPQSSAGLRSKSHGLGLSLGCVEAEMSGNTPKSDLQANNYFRLHRCHSMLKDYHNLCARLYKPYYRIWEGVNGYFDLPVWSVHEGKFTTQ